MSSNGSQSEWLDRRIAYYRTAFGKGLGKRANPVLAAAIARAASLLARAEWCRRDAGCSYNDLVRVDHRAELAVKHMERIKEADRERDRPSLGKAMRDLLREEQGF